MPDRAVQGSDATAALQWECDRPRGGTFDSVTASRALAARAIWRAVRIVISAVRRRNMLTTVCTAPTPSKLERWQPGASKLGQAGASKPGWGGRGNVSGRAARGGQVGAGRPTDG